MGTCTLLSTSTIAGEKRSSSGAASAAVAGSSSTQLSSLIDSADYAPADKEALIAGLRVAAPFGSTHDLAAHVSQQTIDVQVKKSSSDLRRSIALIFDVANCLDQNRREYLASPDFKRLPSKERSSVAAHLETISDQYSARALETLFAANGRAISVPANVSRSASDPDYQQLLILTARVLQQSNTDVAAAAPAKQVPVATPPKGVVAPPAESPAPVVAPAAEVVVAAPAAPVAPVVEAPVPTPAPAPAPAVVAPVVTEKSAVAVAPVVAPEPAVPVVTPAPEATPAPKVAAPAPVTAPVVAAPAPSTETYTLKTGDSLAYVARLKKVSIRALLEANPDLTPSQMRVGQTLVIPSAASTAAPAAKREVTGDKTTAMLTPRAGQ